MHRPTHRRLLLVGGLSIALFPSAALMVIERKRVLPNPFEDGHAAERVVKIPERKLPLPPGSSQDAELGRRS